MKELFYERVKQFFGATVGLITLLFFACLPLYPYFKLPLHINLVLGGMLITLTLGIFSLILVLTLRKKLFPIYTKEETQWVQKAIRRYFWLYFLASLPFFFSFIVYIIFFSGIKVFKPERLDKLGFKQVALDIAKTIPDNEIKACAEKTCKNLIFTKEGRVLFYIASNKGLFLCPSAEDRIFYVKLGEKPVDEVLNYIVSKGYKIAVLEKEVFKGNTSVLKQRLEALGIKTYIL